MNEWWIPLGEQDCGLKIEASTTRSFWCLGNRRLASSEVVILVKGGSQLALEDASIDGIRYLGDGVHCLTIGGEVSSCFETESADFHETVDEDPTCSS